MRDRTGRGAILAAALLLAALPGSPQDFQKALGGRYAEALRQVRARASTWCRQLESLEADPRVLVPVVFPELLKRSLLRDEVESLGLAVLYVTGGIERGDFSIGPFQMKPSFIEALEARLAAAPNLPACLEAILDYGGAADGRSRRTARLDRLRQERWQLLYLAGFSFIAGSLFDLSPLTEEERIRFLAAAYNRGFWFSAEEIREAATWRLFPRGSAGAPGPFRYCDIAVDFYRTCWRGVYEEVCSPRRAPG